MDKVLKFFQILNQIVWILVGLSTLYFMYQLITGQFTDKLMKELPTLMLQAQTQALKENSQINPQELINQYLKGTQR
jgi:hypothetical protein